MSAPKPRQISVPDPERFWSKVRKGDGCWEWIGGLANTGYGKFRVGVTTRDTIGAHRVSWVLAHGQLPDDALVCHACDNKKCVNPAHLFLGSPADNYHDLMRKGLHMTGERHGSARLTEEQVKTIRTLRADGAPIQELAKRFGLTYQGIRAITLRKIWKQVA